jgi:hypothetical protein
MTDFIDLNLKAGDKAAMTEALLAAGFIEGSETGAIYHPTASLQLLPLGMVTRPTGECTKGLAQVSMEFGVPVAFLREQLARLL